MDNFTALVKKEFNSYFSSPAGWLFLGTFLAVSLFIFFWAEAFFARNIADLKPLFKWMPVTLIFLVAALTMRSWSEERRAGTLEYMLTKPVSVIKFTMAKFLASLLLVAIALILTLPLTFTVSMLGNVDWGPILGGYIASLFLASAYISIGLYASARTDNPIVALILTVAISGAFFLIGSNSITSLFNHSISGVLALFGSGARFESITRGVLDLRDIIYYLSVMAVFFALTLFTIERVRWIGNESRPQFRGLRLICALSIANFLLVNVWMNNVGSARIDLTSSNRYSLSNATKLAVQNLTEPLLLRGYFSSKSHPLLEPLLPQIKDVLEEYQVLGGNQIRVEFVDPHSDQEIEQEAVEKYAIRPVPFRMASRYESGVVNSYFDLLVSYGDQYETLSYDDLIEVKASVSGEPEVLLKNPEYAISTAIKKVSQNYASGGGLFDTLTHPVKFTGYISPGDSLPEDLKTLRTSLEEVLQEFEEEGSEKFSYSIQDPASNGGEIAKQLETNYGFGPQIANLFDPKQFWFYMLIEGKDELLQVPLPTSLEKNELKNSVTSALQRLSPSYLKTVAVVVPQNSTVANPYAPQPGLKTYSQLRSVLSESVKLVDTDLTEGQVPTTTDLLLVLAPDQLDDKQVFAIDQFVMKGGTAVIATSPYDVQISNTLTASEHLSGLTDWFKHHGIEIKQSMILDPVHASLPVPVRRNLGMVSVNEIQMMPYPHFADLRGVGLNQNHPLTADLDQLTVNWASPVTVKENEASAFNTNVLAQSSKGSWLSSNLNVMPNYQQFPNTGFQISGDTEVHTVATALKGKFSSYFSDKPSPLLRQDKEDKNVETTNETEQAAEEEKTVVGEVIKHSSDSAGIILIASNGFAADATIQLASQGQGTLYTKPLEFIQNSIDWALGDASLLQLRSQTQLARTLRPMPIVDRKRWEIMNYGFALIGLFAIWIIRWFLSKRAQTHYTNLLAEV